MTASTCRKLDCHFCVNRSKNGGTCYENLSPASVRQVDVGQRDFHKLDWYSRKGKCSSGSEIKIHPRRSIFGSGGIGEFSYLVDDALIGCDILHCNVALYVSSFPHYSFRFTDRKRRIRPMP